MMIVARIILAGTDHLRHVKIIIPAMVALNSSRGKCPAPRQAMDSREIGVA
jgi:hypothetical protein